MTLLGFKTILPKKCRCGKNSEGPTENSWVLDLCPAKWKQISKSVNVHGIQHSQNAGLGSHFPMDAHEGGVEPRKPGLCFYPDIPRSSHEWRVLPCKPDWMVGIIFLPLPCVPCGLRKCIMYYLKLDEYISFVCHRKYPLSPHTKL